MGNTAVFTAFYTIGGICIVSAAFISKGIERTETVYTVKIFFIACLMTGKEFAIPVAKKTKEG